MKWSDPDIALLREGKLPKGHTPKACRTKCYLLGIPLTGELLRIDMTPHKYNKVYSEEDLELLANNIMPEGWSYELCRYVCRTRLNKKFLQKSTARLSRIRERAERILLRLRKGETQKAIAESMGISHQRVAQILNHYQKIRS